MKSNQQVATCDSCSKFIKNIPYQEPQFYFGKYKGTKVSEITDLGYLQWYLEFTMGNSQRMKDAVKARIEQLENAGR